jgi:polar amino acid transport system substrate-binding protein
MPRMAGKRLLVLAGLGLLAGAAHAEIPERLEICGGAEEWPPFTYLSPDPAAVPGTVVGYNVEYLKLIFPGAKPALRVRLLPFARCVALGAEGHVDIVLDALDTPERRQKFLVARPHYAVGRRVLLYRSSDGPPRVDSREAVHRLRLCLLTGYRYSDEEPSAPNRSETAHSFETAIQMLVTGRCDGYVANREVLLGFKALGRLDALGLSRLAAVELPWDHPSYPFMVGRALPYAEELRAALNAGIEHAEHSGDAERLWQAYAGAAD